jgi:hypothetical protein
MATISGKGLNIFIGAVNSNFSDSRNWSQQRVPSGSDTAIINSNCTFNIDRTLGALIVNPSATASIGSGRTLTVNGTLNVQGHLSASGNPSLYFNGPKNIIRSFSPGTSTVYYYGGNQTVPGTTYCNLQVGGFGNRLATGNLIVSGNLAVGPNNTGKSASLDLAANDLVVLGTATVGGAGNTDNPLLRKSQPGNVIFGGALLYDTNQFPGIDFSGNPSIEFRGGITAFATNANFGRGTVVFSNNQTLSINNFGGGATIRGPVLISGSTTVTNGGSSYLTLLGTVNGTSANSQLRNNGFLTLADTLTMATGAFDVTSSANSVTYTINQDYTLPKTTYSTLIVNGLGAGTIAGNLVVSGSFTMRTSSFNLGTYSATVLGTTTIGGAGIAAATLIKSGSGTLDFQTFRVDVENVSPLNISGSPNIIIRNGTGGSFSYVPQGLNFNSSSVFYSGSQTVTTFSSVHSYTYNNTASISGSLTAVNGTYIFNAPLVGSNTSASFISQTTVYYRTLQQPMLTGLLNVSSSSNTFIYDLSGSQNIAGGTYRNLTIAGSGSKTLQGNVSVLNTLVTGSSMTLITGSFTLTNP